VTIAPGGDMLKRMKTVGEPEEIRIPREDERPQVLPIEEPAPDPAQTPETNPVNVP
jgi:hypothetical protein